MAEKLEKQKKEKKEKKEIKSEKAGSGTPDLASRNEETQPQNPRHHLCWIPVNHLSTKNNEPHIFFLKV